MKKIISIVLIIVLALSLFTLTACQSGNKDDKIIKVGASPAPHKEILEEARAYIESKGYKLEIFEFTDYILPNTATEDGSLDANYFQHQPYLTNFNAEYNINLVSVLGVHFEPLGLYKGQKGTDFASLKAGDKIAIPDDLTNGARALQLLASEGIIKINNDKGLNTTLKDCDVLGLNVIPLEAGLIGVQLPELAFAVINTNYALDFKLQDKRVASERADGDGAKTFENILVVKSENANSAKTKILIEALSQANIKDFINNKYNGEVIPMI